MWLQGIPAEEAQAAVFGQLAQAWAGITSCFHISSPSVFAIWTCFIIKKKTKGNLTFYNMEEKKENAYQLDIFKGAVSWIFLPFGRARPAISSCFQEQFGVHYHAQGLKHLDHSIDSRITPACIRSIRLDSDFTFCAGSRLSPGVRNSGGSGFPPKSPHAMPLCI